MLAKHLLVGVGIALGSLPASAQTERELSARWEGLVIETSDGSRVRAHAAGSSADAWAIDVNDVLPETSTPASIVGLRVYGDELYVGAGDHVIALDPATGSSFGTWRMPWETLGHLPDPHDEPKSPKKSDGDCNCSLAPADGAPSLGLAGLIALAALGRRRHRRS